MEQETSKKRSKKGIVAAVLACCLVVGGVAGVLAWLTATDIATNTFTVGNFNEPTVKPDPSNPDQPGSEASTDGYLIETKWVPDSKILPGSDNAVDKNPNVGLGADSDPAYIFVYVENKTQADDSTIATDAPVFSLNSGWEAVTGYSDLSTATGETDKYTGGLFVYGTEDSPNVMASTGADDYTGEVFSKVHAPASADLSKYADDNPQMVVRAYIYAQKADASGSEEGSATAAVAAAKAWVDDLKKASVTS